VRLPAALAEISSRAVRERFRRGEDVSALVPPEILPFVRDG
jgi:nicotinic acid mononucleotide adenylyltransferase